MYFTNIVKTMGSLAIFSCSSFWSILDIVYEHTKNDKVVHILTHGSISDMGVTTPSCRMYLYINIKIYVFLQYILSHLKHNEVLYELISDAFICVKVTTTALRIAGMPLFSMI